MQFHATIKMMTPKTYKMKKIILFLFLGIFLISLVSPVQQSLGTFKSGGCVNLIQICDNCSYNNISTILYPNSSVVASNLTMNKDDTYYNYSFCNTSTLGNYIVNGYGDLDGVKTTWSYDFEITPSGRGSPTSGESTIFIVSLASMFLICILFFLISNSFKGNTAAVSGSKEARFVFIALSFVVGVIAVLYSIVSLMEIFWGFDKIISSYSNFLYIILAILFILFIFILINIQIRVIEAMRIKRGLKDLND